MADRKGKRSPKKHKDNSLICRSQAKIVKSVEIDPDQTAITILFQDKTALSFDLSLDLPYSLSCRIWKTENWKLVGNQTMESDSQQNINVMAIIQIEDLQSAMADMEFLHLAEPILLH